MVGNLLEVFDFVAYGTFAVPMGRVFFPAHDPFVSLLLSVAAFGIGFVTRPLGALAVGLVADRHGRRAGMLISLGLMGLGSLIIAVLPGAASIGLAAPLLLVLARLIQGLAWGAEAGPATTYLLENARPGREGLTASWQSASQCLAALLSALVGLATAALVGQAAMADWGWRVPFALGVLVLPVGLALRRGLADPPPPALPERTSRTRLLLGSGPLTLCCALMLVVAGTVSQYFLNYTTTYALAVLHMPQNLALLGTVIAMGVGAAAALGGGALSDRVGAFSTIVLPRLALGLLIVPMLMALTAHPAPWLFGLVVATIALLHVGSFAAALVLLCALFPPAVRSTGFGLLYALGISLFGGTAQIVFTALIHWTGDPASPAWYLAGLNLLCALAALRLCRPRRVAQLD